MKSEKAKDIERKNRMAGYDIQCKKVLSNSYILAWMMQETMEEYSNLSRDFIRRCIEKNIHMDREKNIRFSTFVPRDMGQMNMVVHTFYRTHEDGDEYALVMQGLRDDEKFDVYDEDGMEEPIFGILNKIYSIWIGVDTKKWHGNCISIYDIQKKQDIPNVSEEFDEHGLSVAMIYFQPGYEKDKPFFNMLNTVLSPTLPIAHKKQILWNDYQIPIEKEFEKELKFMCQLSQWVYACGVKDVVTMLLKQKVLSDAQILQVSKLSREELEFIKEELKMTA